MYLFQLGHANRERDRHGGSKKRTVIPSYRLPSNVDVPEGTHAILPDGITTVLLTVLPAGTQQRLKIILTQFLLLRKKTSCK